MGWRVRHSGAFGHDVKAVALGGPQRAEVPAVEREHLKGAVALRQDDYRSIGETELEVGEVLDDSLGAADVRGSEGLQGINPSRQVIDQSLLCAPVRSACPPGSRARRGRTAT